MRFNVERQDGSASSLDIAPTMLIIAGWTGRDRAALDAHVEELAELGVARPKAVPLFYRVSAALLTHDAVIELPGREASGEVEAVLWKQDGVLYVGIGSDHTDRALETVGITLSKQLCAKPVSSTLWPWRDISARWDDVLLRSTIDGGVVYQEGPASALRRPDELWVLYEARHGPLSDGAVMFCGTLPAQGGIRFADAMELMLVDQAGGRVLSHGYAVGSPRRERPDSQGCR